MTTIGLTKRTAQQKEDTITALSKKPIKELWEKQALVTAEQNHVFSNYTKAVRSHRFDDAKQLEKQSHELEEKERDLKEAIRRKK